VICLDFGIWGTPGSEGWVYGVILVLRTFPELVWRVFTKFGIDWSGSSGVKEGYRYIGRVQTVCFIYIDRRITYFLQYLGSPSLFIP